MRTLLFKWCGVGWFSHSEWYIATNGEYRLTIGLGRLVLYFIKHPRYYR